MKSNTTTINQFYRDVMNTPEVKDDALASDLAEAMSRATMNIMRDIARDRTLPPNPGALPIVLEMIIEQLEQIAANGP